MAIYRFKGIKLKHFQSQLAKLPLVNAVRAIALPPIFKDLGQPVILTSLVVTGLLMGIRHFGGLEKFELATYDHFISLRPDQGEDPRLLIVGITEEDIQSRREWPLTDKTVAQLLAKLETFQPRVISLDIMRDVPLEPGREQLLNLLSKSTNIISVCKASTPNYVGVPPPPGVLPEYVGFADLVIDPGGTLRRSLLWMTPPAPAGELAQQTRHFCSGADSILSLSLQSAFYYLAQENIYPELTETGDLKLGKVSFSPLSSNFGGYQTIDTGGYQIMLNYRSEAHPTRIVTLTDLLENRVNPTWIRDRIVFVGYLTPQAGDDFYTPYSQAQRDDQKMPGVTIHAQSTSQILSAVLNQHALIWSWSNPLEILWSFVWALTGGMLAWYIRRPWRLSLAVLIVAGGLYGVCFLFILLGGWIPLVPPVIALGATASSTITVLNQRLKTENLRIKTELDITRRLQQMILPPEQELQAITELDISGYMNPCDEVGGDYYDVLSHNGHIKIGIGDVTGHGLESGLIMIMVQTAVRTLLESEETDTRKFLNLLNRAIYHNVQRINCDKAMTLSLLDYKEGTLYLSGQHEEVLVVRANGQLEQIDTIDLGFPIALEEDIEDFISQTQITLNPGDLVVLYTDGITEAMNDDRELYSLQRLCDVVVNNHQRSASEIKACVIEDVRRYIGRQTIFDDITLLVIKQR